jgi:hypothetical protein
MKPPKLSLGLSATVLAALCLLAADVALLTENRFLRAQLHLLTNLDPGRPMAGMSGVGADGKFDFVGFGVRKRPTLVLVFSPTCEVCRANWPNWDAILPKTSSEARVVAVNLGGHLPNGYVTKYHIDAMDLLVQPFSEGVLENHFQLTPETIIVDANGRVKGAWLGALTPRDIREVEELLGTAHAIRKAARSASLTNRLSPFYEQPRKQEQNGGE